MAGQPTRKCYIAGIIERSDQHILIQLAAGSNESSRTWQFPRGPVQGDESPEAAMRTLARDTLGLSIDIAVGQPPLQEEMDGAMVELRYFFCGVSEGDRNAEEDSSIRWICKQHLREYEFDSLSQPVVQWILQP